MSGAPSISEATLKLVRDYVVDEPSFTVSFAAWDISTNRGRPITATAVSLATKELLRLGIVELIEDNGRRGKVYAYVEPPQNGTAPRSRPPLPELDSGIGIGVEGAQTGRIVPHTRPRGESDSPGKTRKRQERGVKIKRARQGT